jgi:hypothetical protein
MVEGRVCTKCGQYKTREHFRQHKSYKDGLFSWCKECHKAYCQQRRKDNPMVLEKEKQNYRRLRLEAMQHYCPDGVLRCACCGETEIKFLSIDHIDGGGNQHRNQIGRAPGALFWWLKKNNYPPGFQVLCHNCNLAKGFYGACPHQEKKQ